MSHDWTIPGKEQASKIPGYGLEKTVLLGYLLVVIGLGPSAQDGSVGSS